MRRLGPAALPLLSGCFLLDFANPIVASTSEWHETGPVRRPRRDVFDRVATTARRQGFTLRAGDSELHRIETDWKVRMSTHWRHGYRTRLEIDLPGDNDGINVRVRSIREINDDTANPLDPDSARWISAGHDQAQEKRIAEPALRLCQALKVSFHGIAR